MCSVIQYIKLLKALQLSGINKISKNKLFITNKYSTMSVLTTFDSKKYLTITTGNVSTNFFYFWLRDHCQCEECYNHLTFQRKITVTDIPDSIKSRDCLIEKDVLKIVCKYKVLFGINYFEIISKQLLESDTKTQIFIFFKN